MVRWYCNYYYLVFVHESSKFKVLLFTPGTNNTWTLNSINIPQTVFRILATSCMLNILYPETFVFLDYSRVKRVGLAETLVAQRADEFFSPSGFLKKNLHVLKSVIIIIKERKYVRIFDVWSFMLGVFRWEETQKIAKSLYSTFRRSQWDPSSENNVGGVGERRQLGVHYNINLFIPHYLNLCRFKLLCSYSYNY